MKLNDLVTLVNFVEDMAKVFKPEGSLESFLANYDTLSRGEKLSLKLKIKGALQARKNILEGEVQNVDI